MAKKDAKIESEPTGFPLIDLSLGDFDPNSLQVYYHSMSCVYIGRKNHKSKNFRMLTLWTNYYLQCAIIIGS